MSRDAPSVPSLDDERVLLGLESLYGGSLLVIGSNPKLRAAADEMEVVVRAIQAAILSGAMNEATLARLQMEFVPELTRVLARYSEAKR